VPTTSDRDLANDSPDDELVALAEEELARVGLSGQRRVVTGHVVRMRDAYPVYDAHHLSHLETIRRGLAGVLAAASGRSSAPGTLASRIRGPSRAVPPV
jgi:protoporphyrinogen oxidase